MIKSLYLFLLILVVGCTSSRDQQRQISAVSDQIAESKPAATATSGTLAEYQKTSSQLELKLTEEIPLLSGEQGLETAIKELFG